MKLSLLTKCLLAAMVAAITFTATAEADEGGAIYTMDNNAAGNHALVFERNHRGILTSAGTFDTGGMGTGTPQGLPSQGSVVLSQDGHWLFVCNAGSDEISVFAVSRHGLVLTDKVASGGQMPLSLALRRNLLYVLNAGGLAGDKDNITAFSFIKGKLMPIPDSTRGLSADNTGPAQVSFSARGDALIVTERVTSIIDVFPIGEDGLAMASKSFASAGATPFGFDVGRRNQLFVSEAAGGAANGSSASSYRVSPDDDLEQESAAEPTHQTAACWLLTGADDRFIYTANAGSGSISAFRVGHNGDLQLLNADGRTAVTGDGSHPADLAQSRNGKFLYSLNNGNGTLSAFLVRPNGSLYPLMTQTGIPLSAAGLAGR